MLTAQSSPIAYVSLQRLSLISYMLHTPFPIKSAMPRGAMRAVVCMAIMTAFYVLSAAQASAETRTLRMYFTHTKESATITFKKNGRYVRSGLRKANRFLRDWRRKEPTKMDPELLDLVWEVYQKSGSRKPIHVVSGYRSPRTNSMLRRRGRGVAKNSQHTRGKALDFFLPDVSVSKLRALGLKQHRGGVGYYRSSAFVHLDTGRVRHWPKMSRRQLSRVFPRGKTIHVPSNGKPLRGYKTAMANLKRGRNADGSRRGTRIRNTSILASIFRSGGGRGADENEGAVIARAKPKPKPAAPQKKAEPVVVAKAEPKLRRKKGDDPFATEAKEVDTGETNTQLVAALSTDRLPVPIRRPRAALPEEQAIAATEVALAAPSATTGILRPAVEIPAPTSSPSAILASAAAPQQAAELREQVVTALAQQRSGTVAQEAARTLAVSRPRAPVQLASLQAETDSPQPARLAERLGPKAAPLGATQPSKPLDTATTILPEKVEVPLPAPAKPAKLDEAAVLAALKRNEKLTRARLSEQTDQAAVNAASVPLPRPVEASGAETAKVETPRKPATTELPKMKSELALGNLEGYSVKVWAVATTTRIGPIAQLTAPTYKKAIEREAPSTVLGNGFSTEHPPIRADRFMGRALTRIAYAQLASLQSKDIR